MFKIGDAVHMGLHVKGGIGFTGFIEHFDEGMITIKKIDDPRRWTGREALCSKILPEEVSHLLWFARNQPDHPKRP